MCGRYAVLKTARDREFERLFRGITGADSAFEGVPRYNVSPMQMLPVVAERGGELRAETMQWWLIPHGSKDGKPVIGKDGTPLKTFNARGETIESSRLFAPYFRSARCLVPADAFYEWKRLEGETAAGKTPKQPMAIRLKEQRPFMFGGLFSVWKGEEGVERASFTIITTAPNALMAGIHQRMPLILEEQDYAAWLDRTFKDVEGLKKLVKPFAAGAMEAYPVSKYVNVARNEGPECLTPLSGGAGEKRTEDAPRSRARRSPSAAENDE